GLLSLILMLGAKVTTANKTHSFLSSTGLTVLSPGLKMRVLGCPPTPPQLTQGIPQGVHPKGHTGPQILPQTWEPTGRRVRQHWGPQTFLKGPESKYFRLCGPQAAADNSEGNECAVSQ
ncbi:hypothetical protein H8958_021486, partial [Nasalis larvatus]